MSTIHALFIAIDNYPIPSHRLKGCVNDARAMIAYLEGNYPCEQLNIKEVFDADAKRENVIAAFDHFAAAKASDTCLLYYTGHGAQAKAPKEFLHLDPDGQLETMVCWDSRVRNGRDLMDKELSYLIWKATHKKEVHFTAIFDCCHSGTNTRMVGVTERQIKEIHPAPTFIKNLHGFEEFQINSTGTEYTPPSGQHVHLAAADAKQTAKELRIGSQTHGAFTYNLIQLLEQHGGQLTYREIIAHLNARIGKLVSDQTPQLSSNASSDKSLYFLGQIPDNDSATYAVNYDPDLKSWVVNAGEIQGIPTNNIDQVRWSILHDEKTTSTGISAVEMMRSQLKGLQELDTKKSYQAKLERLPKPSVQLALVKGDDQKGQAAIKQGIKDRPSPYYSLTTEMDEADYWVRAMDGSLRLTLPGDDRPVFRRVSGYTEDHARIFLTDTESVARWHYVQTINNPKTTLTRNDYQIQLYQTTQPGAWMNDDETPAEEVDWREEQIFRYDYDDTQQGKKRWLRPALRMKVKNTSDRNLFFSAVNLGPDYGISNKFLEGIELQPGKEMWLMDRLKSGKTFKCIPLAVPDGFLAYGVNEVTDSFKVFVSTQKMDTDIFNQEALELDFPEKTKATRAGRGEEDDQPQHDWTAEDIVLRVVRPSQEVAVASGERGNLGHGISIEMPTGVSAVAALNTQKEAARNLPESTPQPPTPSGWELQDLGQGLAGKPPVNAIELFQPEGAEQISVDRPIKVELPKVSAEEEFIIPVAFDPETGLYYPCGIMDEDGSIRIDDLPDPTPSGTRSLGGSIKIFFQKAVSKYLPFVYTHPQLAIATLEEAPPEEEAAAGLKLDYELDTEKVKAAAAEAERIVIFIHGIIGDTLEMPKSLRLVQNEAGAVLEDQYDLLLTFDYENLNTEIQQTGRDLKSRLEAVGLGAGHGKTLHIIAHSMGGLVSRWFIEKEGGNEIVNHLFQLGTPNQGSPYGSLYEMVTPLLATAVNGASFLQPYLLPLRAAGKFMDKAFLTLKQMNSDSDFLKELNDGTDPGIPYTIIAGNTQLIPTSVQENQQKLLQKVMARFKSRGHYDALDLLLFKEANDIAVSVKAISEIPGAADRQHPPIVVQCACDHLAYFGNPAGLEAMAEVILE